jgi:cyanophycin synthetase
VLVGIIQNFDLGKMRLALRSFKPSPELTPGRLNIFHFNDFDVMIDYVHNTGGVKELRKFIDQIEATFKVGIIAAVGDRRDEDIEHIGYYSALMFDDIIIRFDKDLRGRSQEEMLRLILQGIHQVKPSCNPLVIPRESDALKYAIDSAVKGAFITVFSDEVSESIHFLHNVMAPNQATSGAEMILSHA